MWGFEQKVVEKVFFYLLRKVFPRRSDSDSLAILKLAGDKNLPVIPLTNADPVDGEDFINVASPMGLGKPLFYGQISKERLELPIINGTINWRNYVLVQTHSEPGSSGSAIVSHCSGKIVGILVGSIGFPESRHSKRRGSPGESVQKVLFEKLKPEPINTLTRIR